MFCCPDAVSDGRGAVKTSHPGRSRFYYDFTACTEENGWIGYQTVQDTWAFGVWLNQSRRQILIFADGEETLITCHTEERLRNELTAMSVIYGKPPI